MVSSVENCKTCKNAIFDEQWGEYKCIVRKTSIPILLEKRECKDYVLKPGIKIERTRGRRVVRRR